MRKASAAIVPLFLAISTLFWFIWFLGGSNDQLHRVNNIGHLQHLQERLLLSAVKYRYELAIADDTLSDAELNTKTDEYIDQMMVINKIHE